MDRATGLAFHARMLELLADRMDAMGLDDDGALPGLAREACEREARQQVEAAWNMTMEQAT